MEKTLKLIVETDKASRLDVEKAKERREELTKELSLKKEKIENEYKIKADKAVEKAKKAAEKEISQKSCEISKVTDEKINVLLETYENNHTSWEDDIFKAVTK